MNKLSILKHASRYIEMLSKGIHPLSEEEIGYDSVLVEERIRKCLRFVAEVLNEAISTGGLISLPAEEGQAEAVYVREKKAFNLSAEERSRVRLSEEPITPTAFVKRLNDVIDAEATKKLSLTVVNNWLLKKGYMVDEKVPTVINKTVRKLSPSSESIGIFEEEVVDKKSNQRSVRLVFSRQTQEFLLENLDDILSDEA